MNKIRFQRNSKKSGGFTIAELLIVVAILLVLFGVAFVSYDTIVKNTRQAHLDKRAEAIYYAAQSRMMELYVSKITDEAAEENLKPLQENSAAAAVSVGDGKLVYISSSGTEAATELFLSDGTLNDELRAGEANWIIEYDPISLGVYSVTFSDKQDENSAISRYPNDNIRGTADTRRDSFNARIGYYSAGKSASSKDGTLQELGLGAGAWIINKNELKGIVRISLDKDTYTELSKNSKTLEYKLYVEGQVSKKKAELDLSTTKVKWEGGSDFGSDGKIQVISIDSSKMFATGVVILDSLDKDKQFKDFFKDKGLIPGEDIVLKVEVSETGNSVRSITASSAPENSLYASYEKKEKGDLSGKNVAEISYPRHLQNLAYDFSEVDNKGAGEAGPINAVLLRDIEWDAEGNKEGSSDSQGSGSSGSGSSGSGESGTGTGSSTGGSVRNFVPINNVNQESATIEYFSGALQKKDEEGSGSSGSGSSGSGSSDSGSTEEKNPCYVISGILVKDATGDGGLFGAQTGGKIEKVILKNFNISASGNAGALAGTLSNVEVENVLVYNAGKDGESFDDKELEVKGGANAGGFCGEIKDGTTIEKSAAAVYVNGTASAGGFVGKTSGGCKISDSYAGGHTVTENNLSGLYSDKETGAGRINVIGSDAGGFVGSSNGATIDNCYSTCSAKGSSVTGGFIGSSGSDTIKDSYATGTVRMGSGAGAFAGSAISSSSSGNFYVSVVNEKYDETNGYTYLPGIAGNETDPTYVSAVDKNDMNGQVVTKTAVEKYNKFMASNSDMSAAGEKGNASPYDTPLGKVYTMRTISKSESGDKGFFSEHHYGDWPIFENIIKNSGSGSSSSARNIFFSPVYVYAMEAESANGDVAEGNTQLLSNGSGEGSQENGGGDGEVILLRSTESSGNAEVTDTTQGEAANGNDGGAGSEGTEGSASGEGSEKSKEGGDNKTAEGAAGEEGTDASGTSEKAKSQEENKSSGEGAAADSSGNTEGAGTSGEDKKDEVKPSDSSKTAEGTKQTEGTTQSGNTDSTKSTEGKSSGEGNKASEGTTSGEGNKASDGISSGEGNKVSDGTSSADKASTSDGTKNTDGTNQSDAATAADGTKNAEGTKKTDGTTPADSSTASDGTKNSDGANKSGEATNTEGTKTTDGSGEGARTDAPATPGATDNASGASKDAATTAADQSIKILDQNGNPIDLSLIGLFEEQMMESELVSEEGLLKLCFDSDAEIPEGAELIAKIITPEDDEYESCVSTAIDKTELTAEDIASITVLYIAVVKDGEEIQPKSSVMAQIDASQLFGEGVLFSDDIVAAVHINGEDSEVLGTEVYTPELDETEAVQNEVTQNEAAESGAIEIPEEKPDPATHKAESVCFSTGSFSPFVFLQLAGEKSVTATDESGYEVTAVFDNMSGIPAGTELIINEIAQGEELEGYLGECAALFDEEEYNLEAIRAFDISFMDTETGDVYQPGKDISLSIKLLSDGIIDGAEVALVRFDGETVVADSEVEDQTIAFDTDNLTVYAVVQLAVKKTLTMSDNRTYSVTVGYDSCSGIPEDAVLSVTEITESDEGYDDYVKKSEEALDDNAGAVSMARAFDISLINPESGEEYQPTKDIQVSIQLLEEDLGDYDTLDVVHIHGENEEETGVVESSVSEDAIEFTTDGLSVYVIVATEPKKWTYYFWGPASGTGAITESEIENDDAHVQVSAGAYKKIAVVTDSDSDTGKTTTFQMVKGGERPVVPQLTDFNSKPFVGWYEGTTDGGGSGNIKLDRSAYNFEVIPETINEAKTINLYARFVNYATVTFHDQYNSELGDYPVAHTRQVEIKGDSVEMEIGDIEVVYNGGPGMALYGWSGTAVQDPSETPAGITVYRDKINVSKNMELYPIFKPVYRLSFYTGKSGSGAPGVATKCYFAGEGDDKLPVPVWSGHTFKGWYVGRLKDDGTVEHSQLQVSNGEGTIENIATDKMIREGGKLILKSDVTLYALWDSAPTGTDPVSSEKCLVQMDPNYGSFSDSNGCTWVCVDKGGFVEENTKVTRDYVPSSSGEYYYSKHDRAYYGYSETQSNENESEDRNAVYTIDLSLATEDTTFKYSKDAYVYAGWYEVKQDGTEVPYDFSKAVNGNLKLKLHWKKNGNFFISYNPVMTSETGKLTGELSGNNPTESYSDNASVVVSCSAKAPGGYIFGGWKIRGDKSNRVYGVGDTFTLSSEYAEISEGRETIFLDAFFTKVGMAKIIYDANGGTIATGENAVDYGEVKTSASPAESGNVLMQTSISADGKTATVSNLVNNSEFRLSNGDGFSYLKDEAALTLLGWSETKNYNPESAKKFKLDDTYGVDREEPLTLYAVWGVPVTFNLNNDNANWGGTWDQETYKLDSSNKFYSQVGFMGNSVSEPAYYPASNDGSKIFGGWSTDPSETKLYNFSSPVDSPLNLYAIWIEKISVTAHAIDASEETLIEKQNSTGGWTVNTLLVGTEPIVLTDESQTVTLPINPPANADYKLAFVAASYDKDSISERDKITQIKYSAEKKALCVQFSDSQDFTELGSRELYFVYYKEMTVDIGYLVIKEDGSLENVPVDKLNNPPTKTVDKLGSISVTEKISTPLDLLSSELTYSHYAYAIGSNDATSLNLMTVSKEQNETSPSMKVENTWRGFRSSIDDGSTWVNCGYNPKIYVVYSNSKPTIITFKEKTVGDQSVLGQSFEYQVKIGDAEKSYTLKNDEGKSVILLTGNATITQKPNEAFTTTNNAESGEQTSNYECEYVSGQEGKKEVTFTNTHKSFQVEIHVAVIDNGSIKLKDNARNANHSIDVPLGENNNFTTSLDPKKLYSGTDGYAFSKVIYGIDDGTLVRVERMDITAASYEKVSDSNDSIYKLDIKNDQGDSCGELGNKKIYYLYYPMPVVKYLKESADGSLSVIRGSEDGTTVTEKITYNRRELTLNGQTVAQNQTFEISADGKIISQGGGADDFKMPALLDDELLARYLTYTKLGAGTGDVWNIRDIASAVSMDKNMSLKIEDSDIYWSFDGESWTRFTGAPAIYAIYEERGFDLEIAKAVLPDDVGGKPSFTVTIQSTAITKDEYEIEGYITGKISATPADATTPGKIVFTVKDGTEYKIIGLSQGKYTIIEAGNANYILTAKSKPLGGGDEAELVVNNKTTVEVNLNKDLRVELINTHKPICKITTNGIENLFYSLQSAIKYLTDNRYTVETIEMLCDYEMPATDNPVIPQGYSVTITTADTQGHQYNYEGYRQGATIIRHGSNVAQPLLTNNGTLTLNNLWFDGNEVEASTPIIQSSGNLSLSGVTVEKAYNSANGGAINSTGGAISLEDCNITNNKAVNGGAIYSTGSDVTVDGTTVDGTKFESNSADTAGGAIYYNGTGTVGFSGTCSIQGNRAANGGAVYVDAGTVKVTDGSTFSGNIANSTEDDKGFGGAIYVNTGAARIEGGTIGGTNNANSAKNGAAVYVGSGSATFTAGSITGNTATAGGAVGIGSSSAKLYFSGTISITGNKKGTEDCNVYLDHDTDQVINANGLGLTATIGIYVAGNIDADLFKNRGVPGAKFGIYTSDVYLSSFQNDRMSELSAFAEANSRRIVWGKSVQIEVYYIESFNSATGFPNKTSSGWNGVKKLGPVTYDFPSDNVRASEIADDIYTKNPNMVSNTALFAGAYDNESGDYLTCVKWDSEAKDWKFVKRDNSEDILTKLIVYFSEPTYLNIENNTNYKLNLSELSFTFNNSQVKNVVSDGYGYVFAKNGITQQTLELVTSDDLILGANRSIKLLLPGSFKSVPYIVKGGFENVTGEVIPVRQTSVENRNLSGDEALSFTLDKGKTHWEKGATASVIFGGDKPLCRIVTDQIEGVDPDLIAGSTEPDASGKVEYLFTTLNKAMTFVTQYMSAEKKATIEMLVDYQLPIGDVVTVPREYQITLTTAIGGTYHYDYDAGSYDPTNPETHPRAKISRGSGNAKSFFTVGDKSVDSDSTTSFTIRYVDFDGKKFGGESDGGVLKANNSDVVIEYAGFEHFIAKNGGAMYIDYSQNYSGTSGLIVTHADFSDCKSDTTQNRQGGGAIWTNAKTFTLEDSSFNQCEATDQGGAVFHRIDTNKGNICSYAGDSVTTVSNCTFTNCTAKAAGGMETEAHTVDVTGCTFVGCIAYERNAGALNIYIYEGSGDVESVPDSTAHTVLNVSKCKFVNCTAKQKGGAIRSTSIETTITDCNISDCISTTSNGGAIYNGNKYATKLIVTGGTISNCSAQNGGGIYMNSENTVGELILDNVTITGNNASSQGGGVYTKSNITIRNNAKITGNHLTTATIANAAGVYIIDKKTLTVGTKDATEKDLSSITGNTVSGGMASNLRMWKGNDPSSVSVLCNLGGNIGVINPGAIGTQFGWNNSALASPYGLSDPTDEDPTYRPTFYADDNSTYGIIDRKDESHLKVIWAGPPICKITDGDKLLYLDPEGVYPAVFDTLAGGTAGSWTSAFSVLSNSGVIKLYYADKTQYVGDVYYVEMLIENYELGTEAKTKLIDNNGTGRHTVVMTTAKSGGEPSSYPYRGTAGTYCTIIRRDGFKSSMFVAQTDLRFQNIIIDGGSEKGLYAEKVNGGILKVTGSRYSKGVLGENAVFQNSLVRKNGDNTGNGGAVSVEWGDFELSGGTIQNCSADVNGGAIYMASRTQTGPDRGYLKLSSGTVQSCKSDNGGGVYVNTGTFTMNEVSIHACEATTDGGGICYVANGTDSTKEFSIGNGAEISNCKAINGMGGGVFVANEKVMKMSDATITGNSAKKAGGGIAVGGNKAQLVFSGKPNVYDNTCEASVATSKASNVEMDQGFTTTDNNPFTVIKANGLTAGAKIGVYVPGDDNGETATTTLYDKHGAEGDPFGTFTSTEETGTLYGFINDRNGLKGGLASGQDTSKDKKVYWIKIFSLEVAKELDSLETTDENQEFKFKIKLSGTSTDGTTVAENITTPDNEPTKYGEIKFTRGEAEVTLKPGKSVTGEFIPAGLKYEITEELTDEQKKVFYALPYYIQKGTIGENAESTTAENRYLSKKTFKNLRPVCKITNQEGHVLYYQAKVDEQDVYIPAVFGNLRDAMERIDKKDGIGLFSKNNEDYQAYNDELYPYYIKMLREEYDFPEEKEPENGVSKGITIKAGKKVFLTTAFIDDEEFPFQAEENKTAVINRAFKDSSLIVVEGEEGKNGQLTLYNITLDGKMADYTAKDDGGLIHVKNYGILHLDIKTTLHNSKTSGYGGAVYDAERGKIRLKRNVSFGGTGVFGDGTINSTQGNFSTKVELNDAKNGGQTYTLARQDIYIKERENEKYPASIEIMGNLEGDKGSIWVWAERKAHYETMMPFARLYDGDGDEDKAVKPDDLNDDTYAIFRNARPDNETLCSGATYLTGAKGENSYYFYWSGGYEIEFKKIDGYGEPLAGAVFTLYKDESCTEPYPNAEKPETATSSDGETVKNKAGVVLTKGTVLFEQIPSGTYYMKETTNPTGYVNALKKDDAGNYISNVYIVLVGKAALDGAGKDVLSNITSIDITAQTGTGTDKKEYAIFLIDNKTKKALKVPDIAKYGILNVSTRLKRTVIRKEWSDGNLPVNGAEFEVLRYDMTPVYDQNSIAGAAGGFLIDDLPFGTYYLKEKSPQEKTFQMKISGTTTSGTQTQGTEITETQLTETP